MSTIPKPNTKPSAAIFLNYKSGEDELRIPGNIRDLAHFRRWMLSPAFPERGRIDWLNGKMFVDMVSEDVFGHGTLKNAISWMLSDRIERAGMGFVLVDSSRVTCPGQKMSVEPDVLVLLKSSVESGLVRMKRRRDQRILEIEGPPDLVVECVSKWSKKKDTEMLREAYFQAGVKEYWIADGRAVRGQYPEFARLEILTPATSGYTAAPADAAGFCFSPLLDCQIRIRSITMLPDMVRWEVQSEPHGADLDSPAPCIV